MSFKCQYTLEERKEEAERIRTKYPERIPIICEKNWNSKLTSLNRSKFLIPAEFTIGQFMYIIRKRLELPCEKAIFVFVAGTIQSVSADMLSLYDKLKDKDGFLYVTFSDENVFGH